MAIVVTHVRSQQTRNAKHIHYTQVGPSTIKDLSQIIKAYPRAEFKSKGSIESRVYFGIICYHKDGRVIQSHDNFRREEQCTIKLESTGDGQTVFTLSGSPTTWFSNDSIGYYRAIGFYLDGDTTHEPDNVHFVNAG